MDKVDLLIELCNKSNLKLMMVDLDMNRATACNFDGEKMSLRFLGRHWRCRVS